MFFAPLAIGNVFMGNIVLFVRRLLISNFISRLFNVASILRPNMLFYGNFLSEIAAS